MNEGNGGRRRIVGKNLAMRIDNIYNKLVDCILLSLHIDYNLGLVYIYLWWCIKKKLHSLHVCIEKAALNLSKGHPTGIQRQYMFPATMKYHRHEHRINIPQEAAPRQQEGVQTVENKQF